MKYLHILAEHMLLEQDTKMSILRKAISERIPLSIYYSGPEEVRDGQRLDIEPVVMGEHIRSGNLVIWAYVFKGVSKKGLPGWKMFRVDRINSARISDEGKRFNLEDLPGYIEGKAPNMMKSLRKVEIFSPYWFDKEGNYIDQAPPQEVPRPEVEPAPAPRPQEPPKPEGHPSKLASNVYQELSPNIRDVNGQRVVSRADYDTALQNLYGYQEDQWRNRQRMIGNNERPGEGTRKRFSDTSKFELDRLLAKDNVQVDNGPDIEPPNEVEDEVLAEGIRIQSRIKRLINW